MTTRGRTKQPLPPALPATSLCAALQRAVLNGNRFFDRFCAPPLASTPLASEFRPTTQRKHHTLAVAGVALLPYHTTTTTAAVPLPRHSPTPTPLPVLPLRRSTGSRICGFGVVGGWRRRSVCDLRRRGGARDGRRWGRRRGRRRGTEAGRPGAAPRQGPTARGLLLHHQSSSVA